MYHVGSVFERGKRKRERRERERASRERENTCHMLAHTIYTYTHVHIYALKILFFSVVKYKPTHTLHTYALHKYRHTPNIS